MPESAWGLKLYVSNTTVVPKEKEIHPGVNRPGAGVRTHQAMGYTPRSLASWKTLQRWAPSTTLQMWKPITMLWFICAPRWLCIHTNGCSLGMFKRRNSPMSKGEKSSGSCFLCSRRGSTAFKSVPFENNLSDICWGKGKASQGRTYTHRCVTWIQ